jgi:hypothetical protein
MNVLVSDATVPYAVSLASSLKSAGMSVSLLGPVGAVSSAAIPPDVSLVVWNRPSRLSARTVQVAVKNAVSSLDCAIVMFDAQVFSASITDRDNLTEPVDSYVSGYLLLVRELCALFAKQGGGRLIIVHNEGKQAEGAARNLAVAVAESAFVRLGEELAAGVFDGLNPGLQVSLVKLDPADPAVTPEWFVSYLSAPAASRAPVRWIRAGSRGLFGKF